MTRCIWIWRKRKNTFSPGGAVKIKNTRTGLTHYTTSGIVIPVLNYTMYCEVKIIVLGKVFLSFNNSWALHNEKYQVDFPMLFG